MTAHPSWCAPAYCDLADGLPPQAGGLHRSTPVDRVIPSAYGPQLRLRLQLRQMIGAPAAEPVLAVGQPGDDRPLLLPIDGLRPLLAAGVRLLGEADRDIALEVAELHAAMRAEAVTAVRGQVRDGQ